MKPSVGDRLDLEVSKVVHGGFGLARFGSFVLFVKGALPDERITCQVTRIKKNHAFAELLDVREPSPNRTRHIWPEADFLRNPSERAGGADYGHINLAFQRILKAEILRGELERNKLDSNLSSGDFAVQPLGGLTSGLHYRTRVTLHVDEQGMVGPYAESSNRVVPVTTLPLAAVEIENLQLHRTTLPGNRVVRITKSSHGELVTIRDRESSTSLRETAGSQVFFVDASSFWQIHQAAADWLFREVQKALTSLPNITGEVHWDLYGGAGLLAGALHQFMPSSKIFSVEENKLASKYAKLNSQTRPGVVAVNSSVSHFLSEAKESSLGVAVLDPPRSGAGLEIIRSLVNWKPQAIIFIACDPVAFARDAAYLREFGYEISHLRAADFFPHTHHFETVGVFLPQNPA